MKIDIRTFFPIVYKDVVEIDAIAETENIVLNHAHMDFLKGLNNQFVATADLNGIKKFENMLQIIANPMKENLEFRRARVINRLSTNAPFTFRFLSQKLDEFIGVGLWDAYIDFDTYTLSVESSVKEQIWLEEIMVTMTRIKPCNMVFLNKPLLVSDISESETICYSQEEFNYRLGVKWVLGKLPFHSVHEKGVVNMPETSSITNHNLLTLSHHFINKVVSVRLNDAIIIDEWITKELDDTTSIIEYRVDLSHDVKYITKLELLDKEGKSLTDATVYVPVLEPIIIKHKIRIKEG